MSCRTAGSLQVSWSPGSIPRGSMRCNVYLDGVLAATSWGVSATITGLDTTIDHAVSVATLSADTKESERSATIVRRAVVDDDTGLTPPFLVAVPSFGAVHLRWAHAGPGRNKSPDTYAVVGRSGETLKTVAGDQTNCFVTGLTVGATTELSLESRNSTGARIARARNSIRVVPYARVISTDTTPPTTPSSLVLTRGNTMVSATWRASTDNGSGVLGYKIFVDGRFRTAVEGSTSAVVGGLRNGVAYKITVSAYDADGNESARTPAKTMTPSTAGVAMTPALQRPRFGTTAGTLIDPDGTTFVPIGANVNGPCFIWLDDTAGHAADAATSWQWTCVRLNINVRDYSVGSGYVYLNNNKLDAIVEEYTARKIVVILAQHSSFGGTGAGSHLPTGAGSSGDPTGRSSEKAATDWWVEAAKRYRANPYVWFNLYNEPGPDLAGLDAQYRRMLARVRAVAPDATIVLDAAAFANDIPTSSRIGTGTVLDQESFVLGYGQGLDSTFGPASGYGPLVFSVHLYARWAVDWGGQGRVTDAQLAARLRDYVQRTRAKNLPLVIGELGVEAYAFDADSQCVRVALYEQGVHPVAGVSTATGVLVEQRVGVLAWHSARVSGMNVALPSMYWWTARTRADANPRPHAGAGLWDYSHM
ncbi:MULTISPECIES: cellulase family glycosylhydrolase [unclassified Rhodococcus (in: high G+C Gram-positive bacteria)]|uniref:cellulase family glycosylhydrolase n=1 Tax=unclassified Rhodococcus (in: high G+C Gram-positive bacteria) TaxID=192944 RepID=UPI001C9AA787|nr:MULTISPECIES: cellulase family glycosylhydrolase [unclassified Rhodococcus (in: high G+C Gram-positive bacteria)]MBY6621323.1 cellulase family glycosylhydrolase [Rhodococcus sp. BP-357]MBY6643011.1 cellulase family glycosylhydrolase [Rhodococcus sp. BP-340]MBY6669445.1 cellulase family glycosylhydrolase [Rhodococcus sp. BP-334]MBY6673783.1 cellulase family glycosylhydrolase [Rhodococcus sp. BP-333]